jgi:hypothetical protein
MLLFGKKGGGVVECGRTHSIAREIQGDTEKRELLSNKYK